jgi:DNA replication protein DnaD
MDLSYVKLYRKSLDSTVFQNANLWQVWSYCMMRANHKTTSVLFEGKEIILQPGQFISGRYEGSKACKMKPSTFRNQIDKLKQLKTLDTKSDNKKSIITIVNWGRYQGSINLQDSTLDTSLDNKRTQTRSKEINTYNFSKKFNENDFKLSFKGN